MKKLKKALALTGLLSALALTISGCFVPIPFPTTPDDGPDIETGTGTENDPNTSTVVWESCGSGVSSNFDCADVEVPMDWGNADGKKISLHLVRQQARIEKRGSLFVNPGGPGASGADFIKESIDYAVGGDLQDYFDVIGWDPRGVGQSSAVKCYTQDEMDDYLFGDPAAYSGLERGSYEWIAKAREEERSFAEACLENTGELLKFVDTVSTVKDLDHMRSLVGDDELNYLGYSYGTFIGALYADIFPENVGHMVLDGALAPNVSVFDVVLMQQQGFESALRTYLADCLKKTVCPFTGSVEDAMNEVSELLKKIEKQPLQADDGRWVSTGTLITAIILPLYNEGNWSLLDDLFNEMRWGQTDTAQFLADYYYSRSFGYYEDNSTEAFSAINCLDYPPGGNVAQMRKQAMLIAKAAPIFGPYAGYGDIACEVWPFDGPDERGKVSGTGAKPILVVGTTGDPATPYAWAEELAQQLESGVLVTNNGEGHGAYTSGNSCIDRTVEDYFLESIVPEKDPNC